MSGKCKHCEKPTKHETTSLCNACYKLELGVRNNPRAAESILREYKGITWKGLWDYESPRYNPYVGLTPKEEQ